MCVLAAAAAAEASRLKADKAHMQMMRRSFIKVPES
jgi:hypothetical protein